MRMSRAAAGPLTAAGAKEEGYDEVMPPRTAVDSPLIAEATFGADTGGGYVG